MLKLLYKNIRDIIHNIPGLWLHGIIPVIQLLGRQPCQRTLVFTGDYPHMTCPYPKNDHENHLANCPCITNVKVRLAFRLTSKSLPCGLPQWPQPLPRHPSPGGGDFLCVQPLNVPAHDCCRENSLRHENTVRFGNRNPPPRTEDKRGHKCTSHPC